MEVEDLQQRVLNVQSRQELFFQTQAQILRKQATILNRLDAIEKALLPTLHSTPYKSRPTPWYSWYDDIEPDYSVFHSDPGQTNSAASPVTYNHMGQFRHPDTRAPSFVPPTGIDGSLIHYFQPVPPSGNTGVRTEELPPHSNQPQDSSHGPEPFPIRFIGHWLPSSEIQKDKLQNPEAILTKHPRLRCDSRVATLAVKLAKDAYFGEKVLAKCTVMGERELPGLPRVELVEMKKLLFIQFPKYWQSKQQFEPLWKLCVDSVGQLCKRERSKAMARGTL